MAYLSKYMKSRSRYYDIVILPPAQVRERIGRSVRAASRGLPATFVVDNRKLIPHVSLFHIRTSRAGLAKVTRTVERTLFKYTAQPLKSVGVHVGGSLTLNLSKPEPLVRLHLELIEKCRRYRTGKMPWTSRLKQPNKLEAKYRQRYGTEWVLRNFNPHCTLAKLSSPEDGRVVGKKLSKLKCQFFGDTIAICEVNFWSQVIRVGKTFTLRR